MKHKYVAIAVLLLVVCSSATAQERRPNILWLSAEDISAHFGCYGDRHARTPAIDKIAREGIVYTKVFTTAGVCAPCRSGIITGMYQTTLGTQHMRCTATLPDSVRPFPTYLRTAGYYCTNCSKEDYQFKTPAETWDVSSGKAHWRNRTDKNKPFFAVFNYTGCHESGIANTDKYLSTTAGLSAEKRQDADRLEIPPYFPDTPTVREDWKRNYELISAFDDWCAAKIQEIKDAGLYEDTIIMIWSDHGVGLPRSKRWLYDSGTHIPLVIRIPQKFSNVSDLKPGSRNDELVSSIDFAPTVLNLAGVEIPEHIQGRAFLGEQVTAPRKYVHGARDRMDERYDIIRSVRNDRFLYIRNYEPLKTFYQYMNSPENGATMKELRSLHQAGKLPPAAEYYFSPTKPVEELYDYVADPHNITNLAGQPRFKEVLDELRAEHIDWVKRSKDTGLIPEPILRDKAKKFGSEYDVLRQPGSESVMQRIASAAVDASEGINAAPALLQAAKDRDSSVRYWGATGLGNIGEDLQDNAQVIEVLNVLLNDPTSTVRTAAARGLCRLSQPEKAIPVLINELTTGAQWERLHAAIALDEMDEMARPVIKQMKDGLVYQKGFTAEGKYRVRVMNRALNELNGTDNRVK
ncbi:sulfatase-like hydrolase/transferase [Aporhodopirellula aestuarii]|uniref:Sulfatase-like hydrolase/transferase n=1 Tax=Aporhodopirellula aestuarii TaxID=2950107 RepID=A0ABT0UCW0_9BACT|nr:sulfatase-like hydrolase/transferase [Aporhodopirellula aestuarii]MCM2374760.1 sulfatase-like hydrolase/transferase [Aporhodopirellula aestuarii]